MLINQEDRRILHEALQQFKVRNGYKPERLCFWERCAAVFAASLGPQLMSCVPPHGLCLLYTQMIRIARSNAWPRGRLEFLMQRWKYTSVYCEHLLRPLAHCFGIPDTALKLVTSFAIGQIDDMMISLEGVPASGPPSPKIGLPTSLPEAIHSAYEVLEEVRHEDPPATISEEEASRVQSEQLSSWIAHNVESESTGSIDINEIPDVAAFEELLLLRFTRHPAQFEVAIHEGPELEPLRAKMMEEGCEPRLPSGASLFVYPEQYAAARAVLADKHVKHYHVCVSKAFFPLLMDAVHSLASRLKVRLRSVDIVAYLDKSETADVFIVENTFLGNGTLARRGPQSVTQPTSAAHGVLNPRRFFGFLDVCHRRRSNFIS